MKKILLHNTKERKNLKQLMLLNNEERITISFYKYFNIKNTNELRDTLYLELKKIKVFGRIYIAKEGINAQISVLKNHYKNFINKIFIIEPKLKKVFLNTNIDNNSKSFWLLKIKVRNKILSDGIENKNFKNYKKISKYINAKKVNNIIEKNEAIFVDIRNNYEYEIGHFKNAMQIPAKNFRNQLKTLLFLLKDKKKEKIVLYCTGGIRCEKAALWMNFNGFNNIYQIKGGILNYIKNAKKNHLNIYFIGKLFVFDNRMSEKISNEIISHCYQCGILCDIHINCKNNKCHKLFIQCKKCNNKYMGFCSKMCM